MSATELAVLERGGPVASAAEIRAQVNLIQEVMKAVMKDGVHFGTIPGTNKPTLYKAGAEKILSTFRIAIDPLVEDLSTSDEARFRVLARSTSQSSGVFLGSGVGECSSSEEKYRWRAAICEQEYEETAEDRRRSVWKKGNPPYQVKQVRTNHADVANTVLKMAKKRAQIDACLTVTAASDVFAQDIEDLPEHLRDTVAEESASAPLQAPQRRQAETPSREPGDEAPEDVRPSGGPVITDKQAKRFYAIAMGSGWDDVKLKAWLKQTIGTEDDRKIPRSSYEHLCAIAGRGPQ